VCYSLYSQCNGTKAVTNSLQLHCECKYFLSTMNDDPLTLRLNGVDNLDDWPEREIKEIEEPLVDRMVNLKIWNRNSMVIW
jgi:hypothetical protein